MNQRCDSEYDTSYRHYGGRGIKVEWCWNRENFNGVFNFMLWFEQEWIRFTTKDPRNAHRRFEVGRRDVNKSFGPENCYLRVFGTGAETRRTAVLNREIVIAMRRHKRANPDDTLKEMEKVFGVSVPNISRALRGVLWSCCNATEPPIPRAEYNRPGGVRPPREVTIEIKEPESAK